MAVVRSMFNAWGLRLPMLNSFHVRWRGHDRWCQNWPHVHRNVCHFYVSVATFMEEKLCAEFIPHTLMTTEIGMDCNISGPSVHDRG
jgi:hypothetical protein